MINEICKIKSNEQSTHPLSCELDRRNEAKQQPFYCCAGFCYRIKKQNNELSAMIDKIDERNGYES